MRRVLLLAAFAMMVGLSAMAGVFVLNGWPPSAALAAPLADCNSDAWKKSVPGLLGDLPGFDCKTLESGVVSGVNVRVVVDKNLNHPLVAEMAPLIFQAAQKALPKYKGYRPSLALKNVTFIIVSAPNRKDEALANLAASGECQIFMFITKPIEAKTPAYRATGVPFTASHELVHCTQYWNFAPQMMVPFDDRSWWSEATADYLASTVIDDQHGLTVLWTNFEYKSRDNALTALDYDNYPLFAWLGAKKGPANAYNFMASMPTGGGMKAQRAAFLGQVGGAEGLQAFATSFVDGTIKTPGGWTLPKPELTVKTISSSGDLTFTTDSFTLLRGGLKFAKGDYELAAKTAPTPEARWSDADGAWGPAPKTIGMTCEGAEAGLRYALFATGDGKTTVTLKVKKSGEGKPGEDDKCKKEEPKPVSSCSPLPQRDACLMGNWAVDADKLVAMLDQSLRNAGVYGAKDGTGLNGDSLINFATNGAGVMTFKRFELATGSHSPASFVITTADGKLEGGWSTSAGTMRFCPTTNTVAITSDVTLFLFANGAVNKVHSSTTVPGREEVQDFTYSCGPNSLVLKPKSGTQLHGVPLVWYYHR